MAVIGAQLGYGGGSSTSVATASVSPTANNLVIATVGIYDNAGATQTVTSVTGAGLTFTAIGDLQSGFSGKNHIYFFRALSASPSSGAITAALSGAGQGNFITVSQFSGVDIGGSNGANAIVQIVLDGGNHDTPETVTLATFSNNNNATYGCLMEGGGNALTKGANFTQLDNQNPPNILILSEWANNPQTSVNWTWVPGTVGVTAGGIEIKSAQYSGLFMGSGL